MKKPDLEGNSVTSRTSGVGRREAGISHSGGIVAMRASRFAAAMSCHDGGWAINMMERTEIVYKVVLDSSFSASIAVFKMNGKRRQTKGFAVVIDCFGK